MSELKPCPFCGGRAHLVVSEDDGGYRATVYCTSGAEIGCFTKMSHWALKKAWVIKSATEAWNRRAQPANEPLTCEGCVNKGQYENEVEYGYPSPCTRCKRRSTDNYHRKPEGNELCETP